MAAVQEFLRWWVAQLRALVPNRLRAADRHGDVLIADAEPFSAAYRLSFRRNWRERHLDPAQASRRLSRRPPPRVVLRLSAGAALTHEMALPLAAEPSLDRVLSFEIDRISPFAAHEVAWTASVERRDRVAGRLHVRLALLPRAGLAAVSDTLAAAGAVPVAVLVPRGDGGVWDFNLADPALPGSGSGRDHRHALRQAGWVTCVLLAFVATALPFARQEVALRRQEAAIARLRPIVDEAGALRSRIAGQTSGLDVLTAETARTGQVLTLIATLTALLPDDTYLTALSLKQRVVTLSGRSASASRLIPLLAADPALKGTEFAAPVTRTDGARGDAFTIRAGFAS